MEYREWYRSKKPWLCKHTPNLHDLMLELDAKGLLNETKKAEIELKPGPVLQCEALYDHLVVFGLACVPDIIACLEESGNPSEAIVFKECTVPGAVYDETPGPSHTGLAVRGLPTGQYADTQGEACGGMRPRPTVTATLAYDDIIKIKELALEEPVAFDNWSRVVDHVVKSQAQIQVIRRLLRAMEYDEAFLKTLTAWNGDGIGRADLLKVLRDLGLNSLATKIEGLGVL